MPRRYNNGINLCSMPAKRKRATPKPMIAHGTQVGNKPKNQLIMKSGENMLNMITPYIFGGFL